MDNFEIFSIKGDGNWFYRCLALAIDKNQEKYQKYKD